MVTPLTWCLVPLLGCATVMWAMLSPPGYSQEPLPIRVMSFNIRVGTAPDGEHAWPNRRQLVIDIVRREACDFVGLQEALRFQLDEIEKALPEYAELGVSRDDGRTRGEYSAILFRCDRWGVDRAATRWLSPTPDKPGSTGWGNRVPRVVTYGRFVHKTSGLVLWLFNTHFDHQSQPSREKSAEFLAQLIDQRSPHDLVIVTGDLNAKPDNPALATLIGRSTSGTARLIDCFIRAGNEEHHSGTFHAFRGNTDGPRIDYVLVSPEVEVQGCQILRDRQNGIFPSDHFPVVAHLRLPRAHP